jgi:RING finger/CHY zinc finger protein 1
MIMFKWQQQSQRMAGDCIVVQCCLVVLTYFILLYNLCRNNCINCNLQFGDYHCDICNLWMSAADYPYHCEDCGFCRVGGRENFRHCRDCGMCIDAFLFDDHNCKAGKYMSNCPVCQEDLFSSRSASHEMPCGHAIHWHCFRELTSFDTRCPVCKKTAETHDQMAPTWSAMAMGIALQPVPPEMARVVHISCNDCAHRDEDRRWHFLGVQCLKCSSFNTTVEKTVLMGKEAAAYLGDDNGVNGHETTDGAGNTNGNGNDDGDVSFHTNAQDREDGMTLLFADDSDTIRVNHDQLLSTLQSRMEASNNDQDMPDS